MKLKGRSKSSKSVLVNSDLHVGSSTAVCSQEPYVSEIDTVIKPNRLQLELNNAWYDVIDDLNQKPNLLVINSLQNF